MFIPFVAELLVENNTSIIDHADPNVTPAAPQTDACTNDAHLQLPAILPNRVYAPELVPEIEQPSNDLSDQQLSQNIEKQTPLVLSTNFGGAGQILSTNNTLQELAASNFNGLIRVGFKNFNFQRHSTILQMSVKKYHIRYF